MALSEDIESTYITYLNSCLSGYTTSFQKFEIGFEICSVRGKVGSGERDIVTMELFFQEAEPGNQQALRNPQLKKFNTSLPHFLK